MGPKNLSDSTYVATRKAVDALERANEYRNSNASIFDPKLEAATKAAEEVSNSMGPQNVDGSAASQARSCIEDLRTYRSNFVSRESVSRPIEDQLKGFKGAEVKDATDVVARNAKDLDECIQGIKAYL